MDDELEGSPDSRVDSLWASLDHRGDGQLDAKGLRSGLKKIGHPLKNAEDLLNDVIKAVDANGDGRIQYEEFQSFIKHAESHLWKLFKDIDQDENNRLSKEELREAFARQGVIIPNAKLEEFFNRIDANHDGVISFDEWRDFLLFLPAHDPTLRQVFSYFTTTMSITHEGDVMVSNDTIEGLGNYQYSHLSILPEGLWRKLTGLPSRPTVPSTATPPPPPIPPTTEAELAGEERAEVTGNSLVQSDSGLVASSMRMPVLTDLLPHPGYFTAGGIAGIVSRTATAPLDRLKVYLIAQTDSASSALETARRGSPVTASRHAMRPLIDATKELWRAGGVRSLFAGNGLNVLKVMPESGIKFGSYEAAKRIIAKFEGHDDPEHIHPFSRFIAGGFGGMFSQFCVYPVDTLKFRLQCDTVEGGEHGNKLVISTARKMWAQGGIWPFYRGLTMGLVGMFPYAAIDLGTFETLKHTITTYNARMRGCHEDDAHPGSVTTAAIGALSGALGASIVYPLNLLRTRLQTQGTINHPRTYTGIVDVTRQTIKGEGVRGLFKGLTPNLLKVVPAVSITYVTYEKSKEILNLK